MKKIFSLVCIVSLMGCAASRRQARAQAWVGKTEQELVQDWGLPNEHMERNGETVYQYDKCRTNSDTDAYGKTDVWNSCARYTFKISKGTITDAEGVRAR